MVPKVRMWYRLIQEKSQLVKPGPDQKHTSLGYGDLTYITKCYPECIFSVIISVSQHQKKWLVRPTVKKFGYWISSFRFRWFTKKVEPGPEKIKSSPLWYLGFVHHLSSLIDRNLWVARHYTIQQYSQNGWSCFWKIQILTLGQYQIFSWIFQFP